MQNLLSKIISLIVIVLAILSIADGGYSQVFILIVGVALIIYIVGAFNKDIEKVIEDEIDDIISTDKKLKATIEIRINSYKYFLNLLTSLLVLCNHKL